MILQNIVSTDHISFIFVFLEGLLSFFSPCVIPLLPVYFSYLAGNTSRKDDSGQVMYNTRKVFFHTVCFVLGISFAFFLLGMSFTAMGTFFYQNRGIFAKICGILIIILGLFQLGIFNFKFLQRERKFRIHSLLDREVNPFIAFVVGFTFSFAWTPCVGPALSSVLLLASGAKSSLVGNILVLVYTLGFVLPFLILGLFTTKALNFIKKNQNILKYTIKVSGVILIVIGIMVTTGWMNGITAYLSRFAPSGFTQQKDGGAEGDNIIGSDNDGDADGDSSGAGGNDNSGDGTSVSGDEKSEDGAESDDSGGSQASESQGQEDENIIKAFDFTLTDQYGNTHTLSEYKDKVVFLNFWATWCPPCKEEMPDIEKLYKEFEENQGEVIFIGVANPKSEDFPSSQDVSEGEIKDFLTENGYTFPTVFDYSGEVYSNYMIQAFPTTFMIDKNGNIFGYYPGMMTEELMRQFINDTLAK